MFRRRAFAVDGKPVHADHSASLLHNRCAFVGSLFAKWAGTPAVECFELGFEATRICSHFLKLGRPIEPSCGLFLLAGRCSASTLKHSI